MYHNVTFKIINVCHLYIHFYQIIFIVIQLTRALFNSVIMRASIPILYVCTYILLYTHGMCYLILI